MIRGDIIGGLKMHLVVHGNLNTQGTLIRFLHFLSYLFSVFSRFKVRVANQAYSGRKASSSHAFTHSFR